MENNIEKNIEYFQDEINYLKRKKERLETELRFSTLEVKKLTDITKRNNKSIWSLSIVTALIPISLILNGSFGLSIIILLGLAITIIIKHKDQDKIHKSVINKLENNKKIIAEIENIEEKIEKYKFNLKELKNALNKEITSKNISCDIISNQEEINNIKIKKIGGNYGKNI